MLTVSGLANGYIIIFVASSVSSDLCALAFDLQTYQGGVVTNGEVTITLPAPGPYQSCVGLNPASKDDLSVSTAALSVIYEPPIQQGAGTATNVLVVVLPTLTTFVILGIIGLFLFRRWRKSLLGSIGPLSPEKGFDMEVWIEMSEEPMDARTYVTSTVLAMGGSPGDATQPRSSKYTSFLGEMVTGEPARAALGVQHFMNVEADVVRAQMARGLEAIEAEFTALRIQAEFDALLENSVEDVSWWMARELVEEAYECMRYVLHQQAGSSATVFPNSPFPRDCDAAGLRQDRCNEAGGGMALLDFCHHDDALAAALKPAHVAALRIYSTAAFKVLNAPLRQLGRTAAHPLPVTVSFLAEAIGKLRAVAAKGAHANRQLDLWRGMRNLKTSEDFEARGGTELAPMSTTTQLKVALQYAEAQHSLLLKLKTDSFMGRGASIQFLSCFPGEAEVLFPPLTYLKPTGKREELELGERSIVVEEVVPHMGSL